jgi:hypothetical protein
MFTVEEGKFINKIRKKHAKEVHKLERHNNKLKTKLMLKMSSTLNMEIKSCSYCGTKPILDVVNDIADSNTFYTSVLPHFQVKCQNANCFKYIQKGCYGTVSAREVVNKWNAGNLLSYYKIVKIKPCKMCKKKPKVHFDYYYLEHNNKKNYYSVYCHTEGCSLWDTEFKCQNYIGAINKWNRMMK